MFDTNFVHPFGIHLSQSRTKLKRQTSYAHADFYTYITLKMKVT